MPATNGIRARLVACRSNIYPLCSPSDTALADAAPDLLAALKMILGEVSGGKKPYSSDSYLPEKFQVIALAAIDKAEGRA